MILIRTEKLPVEYRWDPANPKTGTNKFYVEVAAGLRNLGHSVVLEYDGPKQFHRGVKYEARGQAPQPEVVFDMNYQGNFEQVPHATRRLQWTSFFGRPDLCNGDGYDRLFLVSSYVESTMAHYVRCPTTVVELGCDHPTLEAPDLNSRPKHCCYTSSPDRGGRFLDEIWPEVEAATGYQLMKSPYGGPEAYTDAQMRALYENSRFWVYPAIGTDSILSTLEAQAAGCIPFVVPHMGLPETLRYGVRSDVFRFKSDLIRTLNNFPALVEKQMTERAIALKAKPIPTWLNVVERIASYL